MVPLFLPLQDAMGGTAGIYWDLLGRRWSTDQGQKEGETSPVEWPLGPGPLSLFSPVWSEAGKSCDFVRNVCKARRC